MSAKQPITRRATPANPCQVCGTGTKGCSVTADDLHLCRGEPAEPDQWVDVSRGAEDAAGFHHYRRRDDNRHRRDDPRAVFDPPAPNPLQENAERYAGAMDADKRAALTDALGLPPSAVDAIPLIGWLAKESAYTFPERDGRVQVEGILRRMPDGSKKAMSDGKRGLSIPAVVADQTEPGGTLYVVEGPTDVMAMSTAGLHSVGRPSNTGGAMLLVELLKPRRYERIVVVGENDRKPDGLWPGRDGAEKVAKELAAALGRPVSVALPPDGAKDVRVWLTDPARGVTPGRAAARSWPTG